jgi:hypothetical protein
MWKRWRNKTDALQRYVLANNTSPPLNLAAACERSILLPKPFEIGQKTLILPFTSLPCAQDTGGENPCIDTKDVLKLLIMGDSAVRLLVTLEARPAWWKVAEKTAQRPRCCSKPKQ